MNELLRARNESEAQEQLQALRCTDGLPVIVPTAERVRRMILASGLDGDMVLGTMGPGDGVATVEKIAVSAVMAGCLTDYMPVVLAAVKAVIKPEFDLTEMQATTHCTAPLIIVNGPARQTCGPISSGFGALGPGYRANATIGRALRLAMINVGGGRPGESDMALLGHPGKFTYCLAEDEESCLLAPLHTSLGYDETDSVVTVVGAEAPHSVMYTPTGEAAADATTLARLIAGALANMGSNNAILQGGAGVVILNPDHASVFCQANMDRAAIQDAIFRHTSHSNRLLAEFGGGYAPDKVNDELVNAFNEPQDILVVVAGGTGVYTMVMPTWCAGPHVNQAVSVLIEADQFCEVPWLSST